MDDSFTPLMSGLVPTLYIGCGRVVSRPAVSAHGERAGNRKQICPIPPTSPTIHTVNPSNGPTVTCRSRWSFCFGAALALLCGEIAAQDQGNGHAPHIIVKAVRTTTPPTIDGHLNDECWSRAEPVAGFTQVDPDEGQPATEDTQIRVAYDNDALYIAARMLDRDAAQLSRRLSKRDDDQDADRISIYLDPMHDHQTGFVFRVSAAGVQRDQVVFNDTWTDSTWDAVWDSAVSADSDGWSAEIRIPLSQLRFTDSEQQTWGLNVDRYIRRKNETDWLELVKKSESGLASRMAHLTGLDGVHPKRHLELLPYAAARNEFVAPLTADDPFNDGSRAYASAGLDLKYGLTSNLTLNGAINPDFGQVEVDPAVVNLSAFETFFDEKRPFFLEGSQIFNNFGQGGANDFWGFNTSDPNIFYSRRIGRTPQLLPSNDFIDAPVATTILGAAKMTGKTARGWSIGLLEAVTDREEAPAVVGHVRTRVDVEPLTNYLVARLRRDIGRRAGAGFITTAVNRRLDSFELRNGLTSQAYVGGVDGYYFFSDKLDWVVTGKMSGSYVRGEQTVVAQVQRAAQRYFQRPDAPQVSFDPTRQSLSGFAGRLNLNRNSGLVRFNGALWGVSPGFEANDLGFLGSADRAGGHGVLFWRNVTPGRVLRSRSSWVAKFWTWNFNRDLQTDGVQGNAFFQFLNYWGAGVNGRFFRSVQDDRLTRGGPSAVNPRDSGVNVNFGSDSRKRLAVNMFANVNWGRDGEHARNGGVNVTLKPSPKITITTGPQLNTSYSVAQYITQTIDATAVDTYGGRYVFGGIDQQQLTLTTRVNVIFSPRHSLQVYAQPLLATGDYSDFKELAKPRTYDFLHYATPGHSLDYNPLTHTYTADPDAEGPAPPITFGDPDFNFKSLKVNAVFRWEMRPGSALYAVWTRQQQDLTNPGQFSVARDAHALFLAPGDDVFLVKVAYWIGR